MIFSHHFYDVGSVAGGINFTKELKVIPNRKKFLDHHLQ